MESADRTGKIEIALRVGVFAFLSLAAMIVIATVVLATTGAYVLAATLGSFGGGIAGNVLALRIYEGRSTFQQIGLGWNLSSRRNLFIGFAGGAGAALLVIVPALLIGAAELRPSTENPGSAGQIAFVTIVLVFGAVGEELLFRGYGFQKLLGYLGPFATILPLGVLFGVAHSNNLNATALGLINTVGWGVLLGYSFLRSGDLWLPIGLHYGWNLVLPLFGANLSGFTMGVTGYAMHWNAGDLWSGGEYGPEGSLLTLIVLGLLIVFLEKSPLRPQMPPLVAASREV